jgi:hypothetical protein
MDFKAHDEHIRNSPMAGPRVPIVGRALVAEMKYPRLEAKPNVREDTEFLCRSQSLSAIRWS